jgi:hypothetical protein
MQKKIIVVLLLVICIYAGLQYLTHLWVRGYYTSENYAAIRKCLDSDFDVPPEWLEAVTYSSELIGFCKKIDNIYKNLDLSQYDFSIIEKIQLNEPISEDEWDKLHKDVEWMRHLTNKLIECTLRPDYELSALEEEATKFPPNDCPNFMLLQNSSKILLLRSYSSAHNKQWRKAFEANLASHRMAQRRPDSNLLIHFFSIMIQEISSDNTIWLMQRCDDEAVLHEAFNELKSLDKKVNLIVLDRVLQLSIVDELRTAKKEHATLDLTPGKKGRFYYRQLCIHWLDEMSTSRMNELFTPEFPSKALLSVGQAIGFGAQADELIFSINARINNAKIRDGIGLAKYKVMLLALATRLYELENGEHPRQSSGLIPEYFEAELYDPFVEDGDKKPYVFDASKKIFYSIGPDKKNNLNDMRYDPSNGLTSRGDISAF